MEQSKRNGLRILSTNICCLFLISTVICAFIGCSSKKNEKNIEKSAVQTNDNLPKPPNTPGLLTADDNITPEEANRISAIYEKMNAKKIDPNQPVTIRTSPKRKPYVRIPTEPLIKDISKAKESEKKVELLNSLTDMANNQDPCVIDVVQKSVTDKDPEVALTAVELLQDYNNPRMLPVVAKAMTHQDEEVRQAAVNLLIDVDDSQVGDLLSKAISDKSEDIRSSALDLIKHKEKDVQLKVLQKAISSQYSDVKEDSVFMLQYVGGPEAVDILIEGLKDGNAEFREEVASTLSSMIDQEFTSYNQAKNWWQSNKNKYDEDLALIEN